MAKIKKTLENRTFQKIILVSCFILSAVFLLLVISQIYYFAANDTPPVNNAGNNSPIQNTSNPEQRAPPPKDDFFRGMPKESPIMLFVYILGLIIPFFAGITIYSHLSLKEKKEIKSKVVSDLLLPDELLIIRLLEENNNELTQKELVIKSNLNKLKISRVIKRLETLKIIDKYPHGMTNKIKLRLDDSDSKHADKK